MVAEDEFDAVGVVAAVVVVVVVVVLGAPLTLSTKSYLSSVNLLRRFVFRSCVNIASILGLGYASISLRFLRNDKR